jgi:RNA polymerase sigma-70 factor, ECF subfamily
LDSDLQLIKRIKIGDQEALAALYTRYLPTVWRFVFAQLRGDDSTSRDIVSETFLAAIRNLASTNVTIANVGAWLVGIARHKLADCRRLSSRYSCSASPDVAAPENDHVQAVDDRETCGIVGWVMERMDDLERTVLEWKYIDELSVREIAGRLDRTEKAIEAMLYRARNAFRSLHEKAQMEKR